MPGGCVTGLTAHAYRRGFMTTHAFIGRQFGNYVAEGVIGEGGMGVVLRARHVVLDEKVAVKVLTGRHASNAEVQRRFRQEAIAARDIGDPSIIDVRDCGSTSEAALDRNSK